MRKQNKTAAYLCLSLLFLIIFGCAAAHQRASSKPAASTFAVDSNRIASPVPAAAAKLPPILRDSTGESIYPESGKNDAADSMAIKPDPADSNLIDDPSKEWK
jgi:hypothetical protein